MRVSVAALFNPIAVLISFVANADAAPTMHMSAYFEVGEERALVLILGPSDRQLFEPRASENLEAFRAYIVRPAGFLEYRIASRAYQSSSSRPVESLLGPEQGLHWQSLPIRPTYRLWLKNPFTPPNADLRGAPILWIQPPTPTTDGPGKSKIMFVSGPGMPGGTLAPRFLDGRVHAELVWFEGRQLPESLSTFQMTTFEVFRRATKPQADDVRAFGVAVRSDRDVAIAKLLGRVRSISEREAYEEFFRLATPGEKAEFYRIKTLRGVAVSEAIERVFRAK